MIETKSTATSDRNNSVKSPNLESKQQEKNLIEKKSGTKQGFGKPNRWQVGGDSTVHTFSEKRKER